MGLLLLKLMGNMVIPCKFDVAGYFDGPLAYVSQFTDGATISSFINKKGEIVWQKIKNNLE